MVGVSRTRTKLIHTFDQNGIRGIGKWSPGIMLSIHAKAPCELRAKLRDIDPQVPLRTETTDCETWVSCHFLAAISKTDLLGYPLCIKSDDKPDLTLSSPSECTGIEITEAVHENQAQIDAELNRILKHEKNNKELKGKIEKRLEKNPFIGCIRYGERRLSGKEIAKILEDISEGRDMNAPPWMGDDIERDWVKAMLCSTKKKAKKSPEYEKYDRNWLLIYDNWSPQADLDSYPDAITDLGGQLFNCDWKNPFDRVFILRSRHVLEFSCGEDAIKHVTLLF